MVELVSGKHSVSFQVEEDIHAEVCSNIRKFFEVNADDELPPLSYEDEEGDTIVLNLGVTVEFEEAVRVQGDSLKFTLRDPLPLRARPTLLAPKPAEEELLIRVNVPPSAAPPVLNTAPSSDSDMTSVLDQVKAVMVNFQQAAKNREASLVDELSSTNHSAMVLRRELYDTKTEMERLVETHNAQVTTLEAKVQSAQSKAEEAEKQFNQKNLENSMQVANLTLLTQRHEGTIESQKLENKALKETFTFEKASLVETIAGQREELSTTKLQVTDLVKENEALQAKLDEVYAALRTLQPLMGSPVAAATPTPTTANSTTTAPALPEPLPEAQAPEVPEPVVEKKEESANTAMKSFVSAMDAAEASSAAAVLQPIAAKPPRKRPVIAKIKSATKSPAVVNAFNTISAMGFEVTMTEVNSLMIRFDNDVQRVLEHLLTRM